jgi:hypothetical protein
MSDKRQDTRPRNADDHGVIAGQVVDRSKVANDVLGPVVLASLMSTNPVCGPSRVKSSQPSGQQSAESIAKQRETSVDDLLSDPMMSALWQAYAITESDVRDLLSDVTDRLRSQGELHRRAEALVMRCA